VTYPGKLNGRALGFSLIAMLMVGIWAPGAAAQVSYEEDVFPVIELRCLDCHQPGGDGYETSGFDLRTYEGLMKGTKFGPVITPGNALESTLLAVIDRRTSPEIWMPHERRQLSKCERQVFKFWVMQGARDN
jgi:hypothetical protein